MHMCDDMSAYHRLNSISQLIMTEVGTMMRCWLPAFKILTYHGSRAERKAKRRGWSDCNAFHVCITSYQLVVQDLLMFKRKKWAYMILDEATGLVSTSIADDELDDDDDDDDDDEDDGVDLLVSVVVAAGASSSSTPP